MKKTNEIYTVEVGSPLLRPGLKVSTQVSKGYLVPTMCDLFDMVRKFNRIQANKEENKESGR